MDINGRYNHIEDILVDRHLGQWFGWSDNKNKIYENLILHPKISVDGKIIDNPHSLPSEKELTDALAKQQSDFDAQEYARKRKFEYDNLNQLELISEDSINDTTTHKDTILAIKAKWPKDNSGPIE